MTRGDESLEQIRKIASQSDSGNDSICNVGAWEIDSGPTEGAA